MENSSEIPLLDVIKAASPVAVLRQLNEVNISNNTMFDVTVCHFWPNLLCVYSFYACVPHAIAWGPFQSTKWAPHSYEDHFNGIIILFSCLFPFHPHLMFPVCTSKHSQLLHTHIHISAQHHRQQQPQRTRTTLIFPSKYFLIICTLFSLYIPIFFFPASFSLQHEFLFCCSQLAHTAQNTLLPAMRLHICTRVFE